MVSLGAGIVCVNLILSGVSAFLSKLDEALRGFMDKTATQVDNQVESKVSSLIAIVQKAVVFLQKANDWMSGNREH